LAELLYNFSIFLYQFVIKLVSPFNPKAQLWLTGREGIFEKLQATFSEEQNTKIIWFHCASLGEFEQGRPVIEAFRLHFPNYKILLTFFSPSGYEIRKNYSGADFIFYLPADTPENAKKFIEIVKPEIAYFVKYEFWHNYISELHLKTIPVISFSTIFRENQIFFRFYGGFHRQILQKITHFFVQNETSQKLLQSIDIQKVTITGDTRFDRVKQIADARKNLPLIEAFKQNEKLLIVGSCWQQDFEVIAPFLQNFSQKLKIIIAPHEINSTEINSWKTILGQRKSVLKYSEIERYDIQLSAIQRFDVLIIDNIGMLSSLYQYSDFAWIGGAYGKGLHNILEAATFGLPIFFGNKNYKKFQEAVQLIEEGGAFVMENTAQFTEKITALYQDDSLSNKVGQISENYVLKNQGATGAIIDYSMRDLIKNGSHSSKG
jgi:3-deoxy-D-manno-octulosonic-acid transferase